MSRPLLLEYLALTLFLFACGRPLPPPAAAPSAVAAGRAPIAPRLAAEPLRVAPSTAAASVEERGAVALFERAGQLLSARRYAEALTLYDRLLRQPGRSSLASPSLYNAGLAHEWLKDFAGAARRYDELMRRFRGSREAVDAAFRLGGCRAELQDWAASAQVFAALLQRRDLTASDRIECLARQGLAHFRLGDHRSARSTLEEAVAYHRSVEATQRLDTDYFVAMAHYYQAAIPHVEFRRLKVDPGALARTLDDKARLLLLAQAAYVRTIQIKNPYWATVAGFQIGSLFRELYLVLLTTVPDFSSRAEHHARVARIPVPEARRQLVKAYLEEVHRTVKPLLDKAIRVFEKSLKVGERVGVQSDWVLKSRFQVNELKHLLSLPPAAAVNLIPHDPRLPEEQPGSPAGRSSPGIGPELPRPWADPPDEDDEAAGVVL